MLLTFFFILGFLGSPLAFFLFKKKPILSLLAPYGTNWGVTAFSYWLEEYLDRLYGDYATGATIWFWCFIGFLYVSLALAVIGIARWIIRKIAPL